MTKECIYKRALEEIANTGSACIACNYVRQIAIDALKEPTK